MVAPLVKDGGSTRRQSIADQMEEMVALHQAERHRGLSPEESERLGLLIYREQQRARYRPHLIRKLRAQLELLEALEVAEHGSLCMGERQAATEVDAVRQPAGEWSVPEQAAA